MSESILLSGLFAQTIVPQDEDSTVVEISSPDDTLYIPRCLDDHNMDILCDYVKEAKNPVPLIMSYIYGDGIVNPDAFNDIAVKRYLYLLENKKEGQMEEIFIKCIQSNFPQILQFLIKTNRESGLQRLILSNIVTNDILCDALEQIEDVAARAYILEHLKTYKGSSFVI